MATPEESVATAEQVETSPRGVVKRWIAELDLASAAEEPWRKCADEIWQLYRSENRKANSFNILWSNTETLRPALYNSTPRPDVRRRFRDPDPVGKVASNVLERSLVYSIDAYDFDFTIQETVLDVLLPGRGGARVKYMPTFRPVATPAEELDGLGLEEPTEPEVEVADENVICEHYDWRSFRRGPGDTWSQVPWVAFEHELPYSDLKRMFGAEMAANIPLSDPKIDGKKDSKTYDKEVRTLLKTGHFWEIWDREKARVLFVCEGYTDQPLLVESDPLGLSGFFPLPRPIYAIEDSSSLIPQPLYEKYKPQAEELNRVTFRINKITDALKVRGAYASNLAEISKIIEATDNQMLPIENASAVAAMGGLDKAIWILPIEKLAMVLKELYVSRDQTIKSIYEITGLGDIMRGVSNPHETLGAQELKSQWGTLRLQRLQREVQRFIRDLLRLKAEIMSEQFSQETFAAITGLQLPTNEQKQLVQQAQAAMQQMPPEAQQQVPPEAAEQAQKILASPTWEDVMALLKADGMRQYRIDIETDSTVQETLQRDAQGMQEAITAVTNLFAGVGPAIQSGILSVDVVKSLATAITRTSRMGQAVEDAIDQIQQPPPQPEEQAPPDHSLEVAQIKAQSDQQVTAAKLEAQKQIEAGKAAADAQVKAAELQTQTTIEATKADIAKQKQELDAQLAAQKAELDAAKVAAQEETKRMIAAVKEEGERERNTREHERAERDAQREDERGKRDAETQAGIAENKTTIDALVKLVIAKMGGEQQDKDREADAENAKMEKQEASAGRDNINSLLKKLVEASEKSSKPRKVKFEVGKDGLPSGATISSEE